MSSLIRVNSQEGSVVIGERFTAMLNNLKFLDKEECDTLRDESVEIMSNCTNIHNSDSFQTGLVIGYVQSGKTLSFTTLITLACDNKFSIVIVLAGTKKNLLYQTTSRLRKDLHSVDSKAFKIIENPELSETEYIARTLTSKRERVLVITVLKHNLRIDTLSSILRSAKVQEVLSTSPVLIIDDEADQASLNNRARRNSRRSEDAESSTFASIHSLRNTIRNHTFLQYTATPQGPLLIDILSSLSPEFYCVISPGKKYVGGSYFFNCANGHNNIEEIPIAEVYHNRTNPLESPPDSLRMALMDFFISATIILDTMDPNDILGDEHLLSMMIHPSHLISTISIFYGWCGGFIEGWQETLMLDLMDPQYLDLKEEVEGRLVYFNEVANLSLSFEEIAEDLNERLLDTRIHRVTGDDLDIDWSISSSHILVGGGKLDRGYTVKGLVTSYMSRNTISASNADTIQQRCRFFGYKLKYLPFCRVYLPSDAVHEYSAYVDHEEYLRAVLKQTDPADFSRHFLLDNRLRPTRSSILSGSLMRTNLRGAKSTSAVRFEDENSKLIQQLFANCKFEASKYNGLTKDRIHLVSEKSIVDVIDFLLNFKMAFVSDIELKALIIEYLIYMMDYKDIGHCDIYDIAHKKEYRERSANFDGSIIQLFSGRSTSGSNLYIGDRYLRNDNLLSIQIHTVKLKSDSEEFDQKVIKTLGFIFPRNTVTFQGVE